MSQNNSERFANRLMRSERTIKTMVEHFNWTADDVAGFWNVSTHVAIAFLATIQSSDQDSPPVTNRDRDHINLPIDELVKAYRNQQTLRELAARFGVSHNTIKNRLLDAGEPLRSRGSKSSPK